VARSRPVMYNRAMKGVRSFRSRLMTVGIRSLKSPLASQVALGSSAAAISLAAASGCTLAEDLEGESRPAWDGTLGSHTKSHRYTIIAAKGQEALAKRLLASDPARFEYHETKWAKFPDGTDNIVVGGFTPDNRVARRNVLFLANFDSNDSTLSQYYTLLMLCESFPRSLTVVLPFYPTATMERLTMEGTVATANCTAKMLSNLPTCGAPVRVMCYDLHTLQNRFFFGNNALATLHSAFPLMIQKIKADKSINAIAFPDEGAEKRYRYLFESAMPEMDFIVCSKKRDPDDPAKRTIVVADGDPQGKNVLVIDDMLQTGGTLTACAKMLKQQGVARMTAFCTHAILPLNAKERFLTGDRKDVFDEIFVTNSFPSTTDTLPEDSVFTVLDLTSQISADL